MPVKTGKEFNGALKEALGDIDNIPEKELSQMEKELPQYLESVGVPREMIFNGNEDVIAKYDAKQLTFKEAIKKAWGG